MFRGCAGASHRSSQGLVHSEYAVGPLAACSNPHGLLLGLPAKLELLNESLPVLKRHNRYKVMPGVLDDVRCTRVVCANDALVLHHGRGGSQHMCV